MKVKFKSIVAVLGMFFMCNIIAISAMKKGPYLIYPGDNTQMTLLWQLTDTQSATLEWGTDTSYSTGSTVTAEYGTDHQHKYTITGLTPATKYYYRVTVLGSSNTGTFYSGPASSATAVKFLAYGDTRNYPADHDVVCAGIVNAFTIDPGYQTFTLHVGDFNGNCLLDSDWQEQFFDRTYPNTPEMQANLPINGCAGNHEWCGYATYYQKYYPYPYVNGMYWSFDYGPAHIVVLDQYSASYSNGSTQYNWLVNDLSNSTKEWKFILLHEPGYSAGGHGNNSSVQSYIQPLCETYGVDIVFGGHNHYYARCDRNGVKHITTGGGGAPLYSPDSGYPYVETCSENYHYCTIDIDGTTLNFEAIKPDGTVIDSFVLSHELQTTIDSPDNGSTVYYGEDVTLSSSTSCGTPPYTYKWESNIDGILGTDSSIIAPDLSVHKVGDTVQPQTITLTVEDTIPDTVTDQIELMVLFKGDFEPDGDLDMDDYAVFAQNWRAESTMPTTTTGWWKLDESSSSTASDSSGNNIHGTLTNMDDSDWVAGQLGYGNALDFDGIDDYVQLARNTEVEVGDTATGLLSVSLWFKSNLTSPPTNSTTLIGTGDGGWFIGNFGGTDDLVFVAWTLTSSGGGYTEFLANNQVSVFDNEWHHVIAQFDSANAKMTLTIDGVRSSLDIHTSAPRIRNIFSAPVLFGENDRERGRLWDGLIDDVRIYDYLAEEVFNIADFDKSGTVDINDLKVLAKDWLESGI